MFYNIRDQSQTCSSENNDLLIRYIPLPWTFLSQFSDILVMGKSLQIVLKHKQLNSICILANRSAMKTTLEQTFGANSEIKTSELTAVMQQHNTWNSIWGQNLYGQTQVLFLIQMKTEDKLGPLVQ